MDRRQPARLWRLLPNRLLKQRLETARLLLDEPLEIILSALRHVVKVPLRVDLRAKPLDSCTAELCTRAAGGQGEAG